MPGTAVDRCIDVTYTGTVDPHGRASSTPPGRRPGTLAAVPRPHDRRSGADTADAFRHRARRSPPPAPVYTGTLAAFATAHAAYAAGATTLGPGRPARQTAHLPLPTLAVQDNAAAAGPDLDLRFLVGNAHQLTVAAPAPGAQVSATGAQAGPPRSPGSGTVLYGAGTVSMLHHLHGEQPPPWIAFPWAFLGGRQPSSPPVPCSRWSHSGDVVMLRPATSPQQAQPPTAWCSTTRRQPGLRPAPHPRAAADGTFRTQGDANAGRQRRPGAEQIKGAAVLAVPWLGRPRCGWPGAGSDSVVVTAAGLITGLFLAPRSFHPAFDPWASGMRVNPGRGAPRPLGRHAATGASCRGRRLLPESLHGIVLERLAAQSVPRSAGRRTSSRGCHERAAAGPPRPPGVPRGPAVTAGVPSPSAHSGRSASSPRPCSWSAAPGTGQPTPALDRDLALTLAGTAAAVLLLVALLTARADRPGPAAAPGSPAASTVADAVVVLGVVPWPARPPCPSPSSC